MSPEVQAVANPVWWLIVIVFGVGYGLVALVHHRFRFFISVGAMGKILFFSFVAYLWLQTAATALALTVASGDLLWALYFMRFLFRTRDYGCLQADEPRGLMLQETRMK